LLADLRAGIWSELNGRSVSADLYRRNLQRAYIDVIGTKLNPPASPAPPQGIPAAAYMLYFAPLPGEGRAMLRSELTDLDAAIAAKHSLATGKEMRAHLQDCRYQISKILYPNKN
jgi:hypothetical protein